MEKSQTQATNLLKQTNYIQETRFDVKTVWGFASGTGMSCHMQLYTITQVPIKDENT